MLFDSQNKVTQDTTATARSGLLQSGLVLLVTLAASVGAYIFAHQNRTIESNVVVPDPSKALASDHFSSSKRQDRSDDTCSSGKSAIAISGSDNPAMIDMLSHQLRNTAALPESENAPSEPNAVAKRAARSHGSQLGQLAPLNTPRTAAKIQAPPRI